MSCMSSPTASICSVFWRVRRSPTNCAADTVPRCSSSRSEGTFITRDSSSLSARSAPSRMPSLFSAAAARSEEHTSELQSPCNLVCRLLLEKKKNIMMLTMISYEDKDCESRIVFAFDSLRLYGLLIQPSTHQHLSLLTVRDAATVITLADRA